MICLAKNAPFDIYFEIDGNTFDRRSWPALPRVGDHVMFHPRDGAFSALVTRVEWGVAPDDKKTVTCNVYCERSK